MTEVTTAGRAKRVPYDSVMSDSGLPSSVHPPTGASTTGDASSGATSSDAPGAGPGGEAALVLAGEFPEPTAQQWREAVDGVLKGKSFEKVLVTTTYDGLSVQPLYTGDGLDLSADPFGVPGFAPFVRGRRAVGGVEYGWEVRQRVVVGEDATEANDAVMAELERGATAVSLDGSTAGPGVLETVLTGVFLDLAGVSLEGDAASPASINALFALWDGAEVAGAARSGSLGLAPVEVFVASGGAAPLDTATAVAFARRCALEAPLVRAVTVDGLRYHEAGASDAEELGCAIASGVELMRALTDAGLELDEAAAQIEFRLAASADQFATIAKFRAARLLWARVSEVAGVSGDAAAMKQHAVTSTAMLTRFDPWVNLLRSTVACFAAGVGGADAITVLPYDGRGAAPTNQSSDFAARVARNTQTLLLDESNLGRVIDPGGGSWYIESLTAELAAAAWAWFQQLEAAGGIVAAAEAGVVHDRLAATAAARMGNIATRRDPLTGVSEFPNIDEPAPPPIHRDEMDPSSNDDIATAFAPLPRLHYADGFELLRDIAIEAGTPELFLASLGPVSVHTARATFAKNFFEAGGIRTLGNDGFESPVAAAAAFSASGAKVVCICSSDAIYAERAEATARALSDAGALRVYLAGNPGDQRAALTAAGVDEFVHVGANLIRTLTSLHDVLGSVSPDRAMGAPR
jgi:methylmalonyl-CoA mutase